MKIFRFNLSEPKHSEHWFNNRIGCLELQHRPSISLSKSFNLCCSCGEVIPWILELNLVQVIHSFNFADQTILPKQNENKEPYLSKSMMSKAIARMLF
jgi:hypothetical protein